MQKGTCYLCLHSAVIRFYFGRSLDRLDWEGLSVEGLVFLGFRV